MKFCQFILIPDIEEPRPLYPRVNAGVKGFWGTDTRGIIDNTDDKWTLGTNLLWERGPASWYNEKKNIHTRFDLLVNPYNLTYVEEYGGSGTVTRVPESAQ